MKNTGGPTAGNMETLYHFLDHYEAAQRESDAKRAASLEASDKWIAEAEAAVAQVGRKA
ncbi:hypothetical protein NKG99_14335 [Mesorhizobium sp. M1409]|uniref:hypothetical protein n=1 Tax=unclassified Mesorhizobium TaxID=325217 RepID=UPI0033399503